MRFYFNYQLTDGKVVIADVEANSREDAEQMALAQFTPDSSGPVLVYKPFLVRSGNLSHVIQPQNVASCTIGTAT